MPFKYNRVIYFLTLDITLVGGVERMLSTLSRHIVLKDEFSVEIVSIFKSNQDVSFDFSEVKISYLSNKKFDISNFYKSLITYTTLIYSILFFKKRNAIYVSTFPSISFLFFLFKGSKNLIVSEHAQFNAHNSIFNFFRKLFYKNFKKIVLLTDKQYVLFSEFVSKENLLIIPNPINIVSQKSNRDSDKIVTVGRLVPEKGFDILIEIVDKLIKVKPQLKLVIVGSGPEKVNLFNRIKSLGLVENIEIIENETNVSRHLENSSVFVVTSLTESFGIAMLEALSVGVPVVAFDAGDGPKKMISDGNNGFLVPFGNNSLFEKKVLALLDSEVIIWNEFSKNAVNSSLMYDVNNVYLMWKDVFKNN